MMRRLTRRQILRSALAGASSLALAVLAAACGQPEPRGGFGAAATATLPPGVAPIPRSTFTPPGPGTPGYVPASHPPMPPATQTAFARITPGRPGSPVPPGPIYPTPTPLPPPSASDPYSVGAILHPDPVPAPRHAAQISPIVARGTITAILPAEWSTPDGKRPANPHSQESFINGYSIYTPILIAVHEYIKGAQPDATLLLYKWGGRIGRDSCAEDPSLLDMLEVGQEVVMFVFPGQAIWPTQRNGLALWTLVNTYILRADGVALNIAGTIPTDELVQQVRQGAGR